jgi:SAM-dependent methyltransferase
MSAADIYADRVDRVVAQRTRLRGPQPAADLFAGLPPDHPLLVSDPRRPLEPNLATLASYVEPDDVIVDVGGGAGRFSLPLALRCRELINVDASTAMLAGFEANAGKAGIANARAVRAAWQAVEPPRASVVLVNHVTYLTPDIVPFLEKVNATATRRVLITVGHPPPPSWNRDLFALLYGETEEIVPGHVELVNVLWELGIHPDVRMLAVPPTSIPAAPTREAAIQGAVARFPSDQWALWPLGAELQTRLKQLLESRFDELFVQTPEGYLPGWLPLGPEVFITWEPRR